MDHTKYMESFVLISMKRTANIRENFGLMVVVQGKIVGKLKPANIEDATIICSEIDNGEEVRILVGNELIEKVQDILDENSIIQVIGTYNKNKDFIIPSDVIFLTNTKEIIFTTLTEISKTI